MTIDSFNVLFYTLVFIVPGFILQSAYKLFIPSKAETTQLTFLQFLVSACINYGVWSWAIYWVYQSGYYSSHPLQTGLLWSGIILISPALLGSAWGFIVKKHYFERLLGKFGVNIVRPIPTSWDYKFSQTDEPEWVLVTLTDGSTVAGYWGGNSFASSTASERDIYIEELYNVMESEWEPAGNRNRGIYIRADQI